MLLHFEELWEKCEKLQMECSKENSIQSVLEELIMKINLYKTIDQKIEERNEEHQTIKSRLYGEILLTLTTLSLKDNINVFEALTDAYKYRSINFYSKKYE